MRRIREDISLWNRPISFFILDNTQGIWYYIVNKVKNYNEDKEDINKSWFAFGTLALGDLR